MTPNNRESLHEVNIGLVMQYHFVALLKSETPMDTEFLQQNANNPLNTLDTSNSYVDGYDEVQYTVSVTGGPSASMLAFENPEAVVSIAPSEGNRPLPTVAVLHRGPPPPPNNLLRFVIKCICSVQGSLHFDPDF